MAPNDPFYKDGMAALDRLSTDYHIKRDDLSAAVIASTFNTYSNQAHQLKGVIAQLENEIASLHDACANYLKSKLSAQQQVELLQAKFDELQGQ